MATRTLTPQDLYAVPAVSEPALSPDGGHVVYVVTTPDRDTDGYRSRVWTVPADGSAPARPLTNGPHDTAPRWSPDGSRVAYLAHDGDGLSQVHVVPGSGGGAEQLTRLPGGAADPQWSPDGTRVAVTSIVPPDDSPGPEAPVVIDRLTFKADGTGLIGDRRAHLFVVTVDGDATQLTQGDTSVSGHVWSPDGTSLAYGAAASDDSDRTATTAVFVVAAGGGSPRRLTPAEGAFGTPTWFPDGGQLLVVGRERVETGLAKLFVVPAAGGGPKPAATIDRNVMTGAPGYPGAHPVVLADGTILFVARDRGCTHVYGATVDGPPAKRIGGDDRAVSGLSVAAGRIAFVVADPTSNGEVHVAAVDGTQERALTTHLADALPDVQLPTAQARTFVAPDGTEVHGWLLRDPEASGAGPLLLDVHGGPHNSWNPVFDGTHLYHHALLAQGWSVLLLNPRPSDGYGEAFYRATIGAWGVADEQDFLAAVDALVAEGVTDPARVVVTGYSYGGFMTAWLSARHPDRWAAAIPGGIVANMASQAGTADLGQLMCRHEVGAQPWEDPVRYAEISPITYVGAVTAPTLVLHGDRDDRCPVGQAEEWFTALRARSVPSQLVRYPGGSHLFILNGRPSHRVDWCERIVDWAVRHTAAG
jgi:dipeptidyl aminopeptidase/acylaminoacyl peptidase